MAARKAQRPVDPVQHADECGGPRTEIYSVERPDGSPARVARCQECGEQIVK